MAQKLSSCPTTQPRHPKSGWTGAPGYLQHKLELLQDKLDIGVADKKSLKRKIKKLTPKIRHIRDTLSDSERRSTIPFAVPNFVAAIESANLYFDFKDAAKKKLAPYLRKKRNLKFPHHLNQFIRLLRHKKTLLSKFPNISELELRQAATAIFFEHLHQQDGLQKVPLFNVSREDPALYHPIYNLVFRARHQAIVMDQEPELELEKILKSDPFFYDANLRPMVPLMEYEATSVEARNSYTEFWSKYVKSASDAESCVENVENAGSVLPLSEKDLSYVLQTVSREEVRLKKKLQKLEGKMSELLQKNEKLEEELSDLMVLSIKTQNTFFEWKMRSALPSAVIHFVAAIEKANLYFDFKKAAIDRHLPKLLKMPEQPRKIFDTLRKDKTLMSKFDKIDELGCREAATAIFYELGDQLRHERKVKHTEELQNCGFIKSEDPALSDPIYRLVHQTREQEIVMDQNPIVELEKIMISNRYLYNCYFNLGEKPVDGLRTTTFKEAQIKYSEFWSKYVGAANHAEPEPEPAL